MVLATHSPILGATKDDGKQKSGLYKLFDFTKCGTDIIDQKMGFYTTKAKSRQWTLTACSYVLDITRANACNSFAKGTRYIQSFRKSYKAKG